MKWNKRDWNYLILILGLELTLVLLCTLCFGSFVISGDYLFQHAVIPEVFRQEFYHTKELLPDNIFQLGAAQNIYNYSYYGLLSPIILLSYLFPAIPMLTYMQGACIVMFCSIGMLMYVWMRKNFSQNQCLVGATAMILALPLLYGFQNQVVFVECLPFVILSLIATDRKLEKNKNGRLILSMTIMIFINYYSSIVSLACVMIYYAYRYLEKNKKVTWKGIWSILHPAIVSVMLSGVLLLPTAYVILNGIRVEHHKPSFFELFFIPDYKDMYKPSGMGMTMIFIFAAVAVLFGSKKILEEKFLTVTLSIMTFIPFVLYLLNGGNYIRNKVAIPLWPLWCVVLVLMFQKMFENTINLRISFAVFALIAIFIWILAWRTKVFHGYLDGGVSYGLLVLDFAVTIGVVLIGKFTRRKKTTVVLAFCPMIALVVAFQFEAPRTAGFTDDNQVSEITDTILKSDHDFFRIGNNVRGVFSTNKVYSDNYLTTSSYTSTHNKYYWEFYTNTAGNNRFYRNYLTLGGAHNSLFDSYMGEKYVLDDEKLKDKNYSFLLTENGINVYKNENAYPLIYGKNDVINTTDFRRIPFPYSLDFIMKYVIVDDVIPTTKNMEYSEKMKPYESKRIQNKYHFVQKKNQDITVPLSRPVKDKYLILQFDVEQNQDRDIYIKINGSRNVLTRKSGEYNNRNYNFKYILSARDVLNHLDVYIKAGDYKISNVKMYTYDFDISSVKMDPGKIWSINHKTSTIFADLNAQADEYMVTTFPYDEGYRIYIDGKETEKEIVNTAFLGCKISKGAHQIKIVYHSPWKRAGILCSMIGIVLWLVEVGMDQLTERFAVRL